MSIVSSTSGRISDRGERGLPTSGRVVRTDPDETMDPGLALQVTVGVLTFDVDRRHLDAGCAAIFAVGDLCREFLRLGPHQNTSGESSRPSRTPRCHRPPAWIVTKALQWSFGPEEHRTELERSRNRAGPFGTHPNFFVELVAPILFSQLEQGFEVVRLAAEFFERLQDGVQGLQLGDDGFGLLLVVPERGACHLFFKGDAAGLFVAQVKESLED